jgi:uncharacterized protein (TIGR03085 family)
VSAYAQQERQALAALMLERGPDAPTLCEGWTVRDLAAHLVLRERRPDAAPGIVLAPWRGYTERVQRRLRDGRPWPVLVETFRSGPPAVLRPLDEPVNAMELFVHHEDVRRAAGPWEPRVLEAAQERGLWQRLRGFARLAGRRVPCGLSMEAPGFGTVRVRAGEPHATLTGPPGELLLFLSGRQRVARVEASGPETALSALRGARLGM